MVLVEAAEDVHFSIMTASTLASTFAAVDASASHPSENPERNSPNHRGRNGRQATTSTTQFQSS